MKTVDVLRKARELVAAGWCKGAYQQGRRFCAVGALRAACPDEDMVVAVAHRRLGAYLPELVGGDVVRYNDAHTTTHADVLALFDRAIENKRHR